MDRGAWQVTVHRVEKESDMNLNHTFKTLIPFIKILQPEPRNQASQEALVVDLPASAGDTRDTGLILDWEDPLEKGMATHSSILASRISSFSWTTSWTEEPDGLHTVHGVAQSWTQLK